MKNSKFWQVALFALMVIALASCRSSKKIQKGSDKDVTAPTKTVVTNTKDNKSEAAANNAADKSKIAAGTNFTSRVRVTVMQNGKEITTSGNLRMRYDDVIQLTLMDPILGITEVGRLELSPKSMLVIDRLNKRYVDTRYEDFTAFKDKNIDFATIQDFFWREAKSSNTLSYTIPAKTAINLNLKLSDKGNASNWEAHTKVSDKYTKTDANRLFGSLMGQ